MQLATASARAANSSCVGAVPASAFLPTASVSEVQTPRSSSRLVQMAYDIYIYIYIIIIIIIIIIVVIIIVIFIRTITIITIIIIIIIIMIYF